MLNKVTISVILIACTALSTVNYVYTMEQNERNQRPVASLLDQVIGYYLKQLQANPTDQKLIEKLENWPKELQEHFAQYANIPLLMSKDKCFSPYRMILNNTMKKNVCPVMYSPDGKYDAARLTLDDNISRIYVYGGPEIKLRKKVYLIALVPKATM